MASADGLPEFVRDSKLRTEIKGNQTIHTRPTARRSLSKREIWIVESIVGQGGGGVVLLQRQSEGSNVGHLRAVKRIQLHTGADRNPMSSIRRFIRELEASAKFSQKRYEEYFVKSYGWYHTLDEIYIAMEYCELGDLGKHLRKKGTIPEDEAKDVIYQVVTALGMMHVEGFAHRDLKPSNILIVSKPPDGEWWVKLCDLGLSRRSSDASGSTTMMGTPQCMAPETIGGRFSGDPTVADQTKADMWCVGETLFQALTGSRTFDDETLYRYQKSLETFPMSKLESLSISEDGIHFIRSLMAPDPRDRPDACQALQHPWMPADGDLFISYEDNSAFLSNQERLITSSVANITLTDQFTQASAQWTTTSPLSHFTGTQTQSSGQWTATAKAPSRSSVSALDGVVPKRTDQTLSLVSGAMKLPNISDKHQHLTVGENKKDDIKGQLEKVLETATLVNKSKREAEEPQQSAGNEKKDSKREVGKSPGLGQSMREKLRAFEEGRERERERIRKRDRELQWENKAAKLSDFKKFSQDFKLETPIPTDMVDILAKDEQRQREIVEKAHRQAQQFKAAKNEQSRPIASSSTGKAREDTTTRRDGTSRNMPITQRAGTSSAGQITPSKEPAKPTTWAQVAAGMAPGSPKSKIPGPELVQSATASVTKTHSPAPPGKQNYEVHTKNKGGDNQLFPSHQPYPRHQPLPPLRSFQPHQPYRPNQPPYLTNQSSYLTNQPPFLTNQPSYLTNQPSYLTNQPSYQTNQPLYLTNRPLYRNNDQLFYLANQPSGYPYQPYQPYPLNVEKKSD